MKPHGQARGLELGPQGKIGPQPDAAGQLAGRLELDEPFDLVGRGDIVDFDNPEFAEKLEHGPALGQKPVRGLGPAGLLQDIEGRGGLSHDPRWLAVRSDFQTGQTLPIQSRRPQSGFVGQPDLRVGPAEETGIAGGEVIDHGSVRPPCGGRGLERVSHAPRRVDLVVPPAAPGDPLTLLERGGHSTDLPAQDVVVRCGRKEGVADQRTRGGKIDMGVDQAGQDELALQVDDPGLFSDVALGPIVRFAHGRDGPAGDDHGPGFGKARFPGINIAIQENECSRFRSFSAAGSNRTEQGSGQEDGPSEAGAPAHAISSFERSDCSAAPIITKRRCHGHLKQPSLLGYK